MNDMRTPMWLVQYAEQSGGDPSKWAIEWNFWCAVQTREEAIWQAYRRHKSGWLTRVVSPALQ